MAHTDMGLPVLDWSPRRWIAKVSRNSHIDLELLDI